MLPLTPRRRWLALILASLAVALLWSTRGPRTAPAGRTLAPAAKTEKITTAIPRGARVDAPRAIFTYARPENAAALDAALPAPAREIQYVRIDRAFVGGKRSPFWQPAGSGRLALPLPNGGALEVVIDDSTMLGANRFTSVGHLAGRPASRAIFAFNAGFLHASVSDPELGSFALRTATEELSQFYAIDPDQLRPCGGAVAPTIDAKTLAVAQARAARQAALAEGSPLAPTEPGVAAADSPQRPEVHLMIAYTPQVLATLSGAARTAALQSAFDAAVAKMNDSLAVSLVNARMKLVRIHETTYAPDTTSTNLISGFQQAALTALSATDDGKMDDVHAARDAAGADIVMLALNGRDAASIGLSYVLDSPSSTRQAVAANFNPLFAFGVVEFGSLAGGNVLSHELGHLFGSAHAHGDPGATGTKDGAFAYSYGYRFIGQNGTQYHDIMAYFPGVELPYFSSPRVTLASPISKPIGLAEGAPGAADAARTIDQTAFEVSTFRLQTQSAVNPGTMINVSTRAFVGTGDNVLIGGFVVNGPKRVLIRAAGPALLQYGVTDALADPVLKIFSGATPVMSNDDWTAPEVGASGFAFAPGSRDAGLVVTLGAGAYTAIVEGKNGTTGSALVEVYDSEPGAVKLINLSTRGYVDRNGKEMFGGFVVQGAAGTTKRVLIRVLGPTLSRAPYNMSGTLDDPFFEVHNAAGELVMQNDDWSTDAQGGASEVNDFKPVVNTYSEKQIAATGLAPTNRREPAVMLDLAPGSYTVIAKPFEIHDPLLGADQDAKPGVAIIEVYEINP